MYILVQDQGQFDVRNIGDRLYTLCETFLDALFSFIVMFKHRILVNAISKRYLHPLSFSKNFVITPEIKGAIKNNGPVVALESTIISHGN